MNEATRSAAARLDRLAERVQVGMAILVGLLVAVVIWLTVLYFVLGRAFGEAD